MSTSKKSHFLDSWAGIVKRTVWWVVSVQKVKEPQNTPPEWSKPYQPFQIAGNLFHVGTYDLACYLITTPKGNILIHTGLAASAPMIKANVEALGFKLADSYLQKTGRH